jgi:cysteine-rich repeat protein
MLITASGTPKVNGMSSTVARRVTILKTTVVPFFSVSRRSILLFAIVACGEPPAAPETGIDLTIAYDSTMGVEELVVWGTTDSGTTRIDQHTFEAPFSVDPPGLRIALTDLILRDALEGEVVVVRADGRTPFGRVAGSGAATVIVEIDRLVPATVTLGAPAICGDGRTSNLEACDDGNGLAGDGCSDTCTIEPGVIPPLPPGPVIYELERPEIANTTSPDFVDVPGAALTFTPNGPSDRWMVFVSGNLGSSDPSQLTAEMRVSINGVEVDRFGHQTLGTDDNAAGFLTFETITGATEEQTIAPQFRALLGTTRVSNLRVVAALVPPGADFQYADADEVLEGTGDALELLALDFTPSGAGDYVVLAKSNQTEDPSMSTARFWLEDDEGSAHPLDGFSSPRDAVVPAFVSIVKSLDAGPKRFVARGSSSSTGPIADWWSADASMRQGIAITAPANGLAAAYPLSITFDHATQVAAGRSLANGDDVFVVARLADGTLAPISRVVDETSGWDRSDTKIWFATVEGVTPEYWLYFGVVSADLPPSDPEKVFPFFDGFDGVVLDPLRWGERSSGTVQNGQLVLGPQTEVVSAAGRQYGADTIWEAQVTFSATAQLTGALEIWTGSSELQPQGGIGYFADAQGLRVQTVGGSTQLVSIMDPFSAHLLGFTRTTQGDAQFALDGQLVATLPNELDSFGGSSVHMSNADPSVVMIYDWVRVRPRAAEEPIVALGPIEGRNGTTASRFSFRKLMAFRTDAFFRARSISMPETATTKELAATLVSLDVEAPAKPVEELLIAAARVSGESSATGRKSGEIRAGEELLSRTAHRIDRDSSRENGYHHVVGVADARLTRDAAQYRIDIASPDLIQVDGAAASITVLSYPPRP